MGLLSAGGGGEGGRASWERIWSERKIWSVWDQGLCLRAFHSLPPAPDWVQWTERHSGGRT